MFVSLLFRDGWAGYIRVVRGGKAGYCSLMRECVGDVILPGGEMRVRIYKGYGGGGGVGRGGGTTGRTEKTRARLPLVSLVGDIQPCLVRRWGWEYLRVA